MKAKKMKLTKTTVEALPLATVPQDRKDYYDSELPNFGVRVSGTSRKYFVMKYVGTKRVRVTLGDARHMAAEEARKQALATLGDMARGVDPNEAERERIRQEEEAKAGQVRQEEEARRQAEALRLRKSTLEDSLAIYLDKRNLKEGTRTLYRKLLTLHLNDWLDIPVCEITKDMITDRHSAIARGDRGRIRYITVAKSPEEIDAEKKELESRTRKRGQHVNVTVKNTKRIPDPDPKKRGASADGVMRVLRAVINFARDDHEDLIPVNPVDRLSKRKEWYKVPRRRRLIRMADLPAWHKAVKALDNDTMRDFLLFLLFTGLRRNEAARLTWAMVDFHEGSFTVVDTKNREPHTLPMSDHLFTLLHDRKKGLKTELEAARAALVAGRKDAGLMKKQVQALINRVATAEARLSSPYVFPGDGASGYINEPKKAINAVTDATGVTFSCHDLRRTFSTVAESLDLSKYAIKALLNHKQGDTGDVTGGYIQMSLERLRGALQKVNDELLKRIETQHGMKIDVDFTARKGSKAA